jgi:hypothetical protein
MHCTSELVTTMFPMVRNGANEITRLAHLDEQLWRQAS